jgi:hypothetical protein
MSVVDNAVVLPIGDYIVTVNAQGTTDTAGLLSVSLDADGTAITGGELSESVDVGETANLSRTLLYSATVDGSTLSLVNTSTSTITLDYATLTVLML